MLSRDLLSVLRVGLLFLLMMAPVSFTSLTLSGCQVVLGLSDYDVDAAPPLGAVQSQAQASANQALVCHVHADCVDSATFCTSKGRCEQLQSEDCMRLAGSERDPAALLVGTMFATSGADSAVELARQRAVQLAVEEINERGGVPAQASADPRKLVLLACDAGANRDRAISHLASLGARAVVGMSDAEQLLQSLRTQLLAANMLSLSTALASDSINSLLDADLAWLMALTVEQRAPLFESVLSAIEQHLRDQRSGFQALKLALLVRYDAAGRAALSALRMHALDGATIGMPEQSSGRVRVDRVPDSAADQQALVAAYRGFAPDIVVVIGAVDEITAFVAPLERAYDADAAPQRPHYLLTEEAKGPALLALARELPSLLARVHGVAAAVPERSRAASDSFQSRYAAHFGADELGSAPRVAAAYDAVYALAYAVAAVESGHELGARLAQVLHALQAPEQALDSSFEVGPQALALGLARAASGDPLALVGASGALCWDGYGALRTGVLEAWCLEATSGGPRYAHAPWSYDAAAGSFSDSTPGCDDWLKLPLRDRDVDETASKTLTGTGMGAAGTTAGAAGSGGAPPAASAGSGGAAADMPAPAEMPPSAADKPARTLKCGALSCRLDAEVCCVATLRAPMVELSCQPRAAQTSPPEVLGAAGSGASTSCGLAAQCASDSDCDKGSVCCADAQLARCVPDGMCAAENGRRLACKAAQECPGGQQCCLHSDSNSLSFAYSACAAACGIADGSVRLCLDDAGCADDQASTSCNPSALLPVASVCWPKAPL